MQVTREELEQALERLLHDNTNLSERILELEHYTGSNNEIAELQTIALTEEVNQLRYTTNELYRQLDEEREMNKVVRDSIAKFANVSTHSGLIKICIEYLQHYYTPDAITLYINSDAYINNGEHQFTRMYDTNTNSYHVNTTHEIMQPFFDQMITTHTVHKELSSLDLASLSSRNVTSATLCKIQYSTVIVGFILLEYYSTNKHRTNNMMYLLLEVFANSYCNLLVTDLLAKKYDTVVEQAYVDSATGIGNARSYERDIKAYHREKIPYVILAIDIDSFKSVNDNYGHDTGDEVLKVVAEKTHFHMQRINGCGYRNGGDEFMGLAVTDLQTANDVVNELFLDIASHEFVDGKGNLFRITNSGGLYQSSVGEKVETVKKKADILLYRSKENGKKQFTVDQTVTI